MYDLIYRNENEFLKLERSLRKYNMVAYKKLIFEIYPKLKNGDSIGSNIENNMYEIELPTDKTSEIVYGTKYKLIYKKQDNVIELIEILPKEILIEGYKSELIMYKGVMIPKNKYEKYKFKIDMLYNIYKI